MIEIQIPLTIKIGGFDYTIDCTKEAEVDLRARTRLGETIALTRVIKLDVSTIPPQVSETFIHEIIECIADIYCNDTLTHEQISNLSYGLHQVLEQLGVRFVKE